MASAADDTCRALTQDGERCSRSAEDGEFCFQHDESDPTVDESSDGNGNGAAEGDANSSDDDTAANGAAADEANEASGSADEEVDDGSPAEHGDSAILKTREAVQNLGGDLIGHELDGIVGIAQNDDGWQVTVEAVERSAVPDTQDILGQYEIDLDAEHTISGYRRIDRYRRGDTQREDYIG